MRQRLLLCAALASAGLPALVGYALSRRDHRPLNANRSPHPVAIATAHPGRSLSHHRRGVWQTVRPDLFFGARSVLLSPPSSFPPPSTAMPMPPAPATTAVSEPLADYAYTGTVTVDGEMSALLENRKDHRGWYVKEGETWPNSRIVALNTHEITIEIDGVQHTLTKSDVTDVVPLAADASQDSSAPRNAASSDVIQFTLTLNNIDFVGNVVNYTTNGLSPEEVAHIKDDAFEGRISAEEAQRRLEPATTSTTLARSLSYMAEVNTAQVILDTVKQP